MEAAEAAPGAHRNYQQQQQQQHQQQVQQQHHRHRRLLAAAAAAAHQQAEACRRRQTRSTGAKADGHPGIPGLDVVRALHQTVISLRTALDSSREELRKLKEQQLDLAGADDCLEHLALENHVLRRRLLSRGGGEFSSDAATSPPDDDDDDDDDDRDDAAAANARDDATADAVDRADNAALAKRQPAKPKPSEKMEADTSETPEAKSTTAAEDDNNDSNNNLNNSSSSSNDNEAGSSSGRRPSDEEEQPEDEKTAATPANDSGDQQQQQQPRQNKLASQGASNESENESEELDDIELIFTTEETCCRDVGLQEDLVSITDTDNWQQQQQQQRIPTPAEQHKSLLKIGQAKSADEPSLVCNGAGSQSSNNNNNNNNDKTSSVEEAASSQSSSIDREESVDRFDESSGSRLNKMWSQCSVLVETDISKCGVLEEIDLQARHAARRNTLAAPTAAYRPIIHREALAAGRRKSAGPLRPMMDRTSSGAAAGARRESGAQTDISALPAQWRSESYLAHKVAHTFTTLPSKFALPAGVPGRLRLSDKTREARRVMLSDISFTSMVPELSRSADHLCHDPHSQFPQPHCYGSRSGAPNAGCCGGGGGGGGGLRTPESSRRESWARGGSASTSGVGLPSPCDCRLSADLYLARYRGSLSSIPRAPSAVELGSSRRHSWRPNNAGGSFDSWRGPAVLPGSHTSSTIAASAASAGPSCGATGSHLRPTWSSMPSSPTHVKPPSGTIVARLIGCQPRRTRSKVTFQECPMIRGSLPNLRSESLAETSGDSTESLIDEAEDYLRRSIDSMLTFSTSAAERCAALGGRHSARRRRARRHSEPDLFREWNPPQDARPYLPKKAQDLKINHLVKVISPEGKILQGRVRYVGAVAGGDDAYVGVELPNSSGANSDGTFNGRRYFDCEAERALLVPFKKVVLAWCTT